MTDDLQRVLREAQRRKAMLQTAMSYINQNSAAFQIAQQLTRRNAALTAAFPASSDVAASFAAFDSMTGSARAITAQWAARKTAIEAMLEPYERVAAQIAELNRATAWWRDSIAARTSAITSLASLTPHWMGWIDRHREMIDAWIAVVYPDNWRDPGFPQLSQLVDLAREGYPVTWVPSGPVLTALAQADPSQRRVVLLAHRQQILDDCGTVLSEVDDADLEELAEKLTEALRAAQAGHDAAAQALATNIMDTALRVFFPPASPTAYFKYLHVVTKINNVDPGACVMRELPRACLMWPIVPALQPFFGGVSRAEFNRHNTAHAVTAVQYSEPNTLIALMLATSLLRQLHHEQQQTVATATAAVSASKP